MEKSRDIIPVGGRPQRDDESYASFWGRIKKSRQTRQRQAAERKAAQKKEAEERRIQREAYAERRAEEDRQMREHVDSHVDD